jgi:chromate transporter
MLYLDLFWSFFQVGLFSFGGGLATMPLIQDQVVNIHPWMSLSEFTDLISISQMTPGPIAVNSASFVGMRIAGIPGALVATFACILPACIIVGILAWLYYHYRSLDVAQGILTSVRPAVVALIASAGLVILVNAVWGTGAITLENTDFIALGIFAASLVVLIKWNPSPIYVMLGAGAVGCLLYLLL